MTKTMVGLYRISLLPSTDEQEFASRVGGVVEDRTLGMFASRVTTSLHSRLMKRVGDFPEYVWELTVSLMTDSRYDFAENVERIQETIDGMGVVTGIDVYAGPLTRP